MRVTSAKASRDSDDKGARIVWEVHKLDSVTPDSFDIYTMISGIDGYVGN